MSADVLYVIFDSDNIDTGRVKIGITEDYERRIAQIQNASGCRVTCAFCAVVKSKDAIFTERFLHDCFKNCRLVGEWFDFDGEEWFKLIKLMKTMNESGVFSYYFELSKFIDCIVSGYTKEERPC